MLGDENGKVPETVRPLKSGQPAASIVKSDDFSSDKLGLHWQWNHNPIDKSWSLKERPGFLRLKTNRVVNTLYLAPNTLTQRMEGPRCSGAIEMDLSHMKDGDCAGLAAFNSDTGALCIKKQGGKLVLQMNELSVKLTDRDKEVTSSEEKTIEQCQLLLQPRWFRVDSDRHRQLPLALRLAAFLHGHQVRHFQLCHKAVGWLCRCQPVHLSQEIISKTNKS